MSVPASTSEAVAANLTSTEALVSMKFGARLHLQVSDITIAATKDIVWTDKPVLVSLEVLKCIASQGINLSCRLYIWPEDAATREAYDLTATLKLWSEKAPPVVRRGRRRGPDLSSLLASLPGLIAPYLIKPPEVNELHHHGLIVLEKVKEVSTGKNNAGKYDVNSIRPIPTMRSDARADRPLCPLSQTNKTYGPSKGSNDENTDTDNTVSSPAITFHPFLRLAPELRRTIFELALCTTPRVYELAEGLRPTSYYRLPLLSLVSREAHNVVQTTYKRVWPFHVSMVGEAAMIINPSIDSIAIRSLEDLLSVLEQARIDPDHVLRKLVTFTIRGDCFASIGIIFFQQHFQQVFPRLCKLNIIVEQMGDQNPELSRHTKTEVLTRKHGKSIVMQRLRQLTIQYKIEAAHQMIRKSKIWDSLSKLEEWWEKIEIDLIRLTILDSHLRVRSMTYDG